MYLPERSAAVAVQSGPEGRGRANQVIDAENDIVPTYVGVPWMFPLAVVQCCNDPGTAHMNSALSHEAALWRSRVAKFLL